MTAFNELGLSEQIQTAIDELGFEEPTPVQEQVIPELLAGHDVIGQAQTGTGKTAAFGLPLLQYLDPDSAGAAGDRDDADARALHPGHPGAALVRRAHGHRGRRRLRRSADRAAGAPPARGGAGGGGHRRAHDGPDLAPHPGADRGSLRRPRRGRRDARPRLHRGRREDPADVSLRSPDRVVLGHDAAADREARRASHVRPDHDQHHPQAAHGGRDRAGLRRGAGAREGDAPARGAEGRGPRAGDHLLPDEDRHGPARRAAPERRTALQGAPRRHDARGSATA